MAFTPWVWFYRFTGIPRPRLRCWSVTLNIRDASGFWGCDRLQRMWYDAFGRDSLRQWGRGSGSRKLVVRSPENAKCGNGCFVGGLEEGIAYLDLPLTYDAFAEEYGLGSFRRQNAAALPDECGTGHDDSENYIEIPHWRACEFPA